MSTSAHHTSARGKTTPASSGGSFRSEPNTAPDDVMPAQPSTPDPMVAQRKREKLARLEKHNEQAARLANAARVAHMNVNTEMLRTELELEYPDATGAVFYRSWAKASERYDLLAVRRGDDILFDADEGTGGPDSAYNDAAKYLDRYEDDTTSYLTEGDETPELLEGLDVSGGDSATLQLNVEKADQHYDFKVRDALGLEQLDRTELRTYRNAVEEELGTAGLFADANEIEYQLGTEAANYNLDPTAMGRLELRFGSRRDALRALTDTDAWSKVDEDLGEIMVPMVTKAIQEAIAEVDARPAN